MIHVVQRYLIIWFNKKLILAIVRFIMVCATAIRLVIKILFLHGVFSTKLNFNVDRCEGLKEFSGKIDCNFYPDDYLDVPQIIKRHGYPVEAHLVITEDGYMLGVHRIPGSRNGTRGGQPVLLQHGLMGSSADWILIGNNSLGFTLADQGYDVWLGNSRGNTYSKGHISLPTWSPQYWNFSWHEMGVKDLPAVLDYIANISNKPEITYIGHSMGTTAFFVLSSILPKLVDKIKLMIAVAPAVYMTHTTSPIRYLAPFSNDIGWIIKHLGIKKLLPNNIFFRSLPYYCHNFVSKICDNIFFLISSWEPIDADPNIIPTILSHDPAGTSVKTALHYAQEIKFKGRFQNFDYGPEGNLIKYGNATPPLYPVDNIKVPIYLMYSQHDKLVNYTDVMGLSKKLKNIVGVYKVSSESFSHLDFVFGETAYQLVYKQITSVLRNFTGID